MKELAEVVGISPVSVRHHLTNLQAEGLIRAKEVRHGVGRPHHMFSLTDEGLERFPTRYYRLTSRLLGEIKDSFSEGQVEEIFAGMATSLAEEHTQRLRSLPIEARVKRLVEVLSQEGLEAEFEHSGGAYIIREHSCPYLHLVRDHPEVCLLDQGFIAKALSVPVERVTCIADGDAHCAFSISADPGENSP